MATKTQEDPPKGDPAGTGGSDEKTAEEVETAFFNKLDEHIDAAIERARVKYLKPSSTRGDGRRTVLDMLSDAVFGPPKV